ncbi:MAG: hypothetical protein GX879_07265 [Bacteroidales bacterium]|nr:hypothetical protein [Bacteroidales bacterium]
MKKRILFLSVIAFAMVFVFSACSVTSKTMKEPYVRVELNKADFELSEQVTGEASSVRIIGIDWARLFNSKSGNLQNPSSEINLAIIPVLGSFVYEPTQNYALYEMMHNNPGYDVVFYPQFEVKILKPIGIGFLYKKTTVKATARLGKLK